MKLFVILLKIGQQNVKKNLYNIFSEILLALITAKIQFKRMLLVGLFSGRFKQLNMIWT